MPDQDWNRLIGKLELHTSALEYFLDSPEGQERLARFIEAEARVMQLLVAAEEGNDEEFADAFRRGDAEETPWQRIKRILKKLGKGVGDKLFDKLNDLIKGYLGAGTSTK